MAVRICNLDFVNHLHPSIGRLHPHDIRDALAEVLIAVLRILGPNPDWAILRTPKWNSSLRSAALPRANHSMPCFNGDTHHPVSAEGPATPQSASSRSNSRVCNARSEQTTRDGTESTHNIPKFMAPRNTNGVGCIREIAAPIALPTSRR